MLIHRSFLKRELLAGLVPLALLAFCVLLATLAVATVSGWRASVEEALDEENKKTAGGDVVVFSTQPFSPSLMDAIEPFESFQSNELFTVALAPSSNRALFSKLKSVQEAYPYYGAIEVVSGRDFHEALQGGFVVESRVLERLGLEVGDALTVGQLTLPISDIFLEEPDRPMGMFGVSPRIFVSHDSLEATALIRPDSYVERRVHLSLPDPERAEQVVEELQMVAIPDQERVETWRHPPVSLERFVNNFFTFLDMAVAVTVVLGGMGMQSTLANWLRARRKTAALIKTLGAGSRFVFLHYSLIVASAVFLGLLLGLLGAAFLLAESGTLLSSMLPITVQPELSAVAIFRSSFLCLVVASAFTIWPLRETYRIKPALILREESQPSQWKAIAVLVFFLWTTIFGLLWGMVGEIYRALGIVLVLSALFALSALASWSIVRLVSRWRPRNLSLRTALNRWRPPFGTVWILIFLLSTCLSVLYTISLCEFGLRQSWLKAMPQDAPNLLLIDIQTPQLEDLKSLMPEGMQVFDRLKLRVLAVDGVAIDRSERRNYWSRDGRREMDASPATDLPSNDELVAGSSLFVGDDPAQVSLRDSVAEALKVRVGQTITFSLQGLPLEARLSSIRHSRREGFQPRTDLLFPPELLKGAPRTHFATARIADDQIGALQAELAKAFPSIVSMDLGLTIKLVGERLLQMVDLVRYFLALGLLCGLVVLLSATWSSRWEYRREAAYLKVLGAEKGFVLRTVLWENALVGLVAGLSSWLLARGLTWGLSVWVFQMQVPPFSPVEALMIGLPGLATAGLGLALAGPVVQAKPLEHLVESS